MSYNFSRTGKLSYSSAYNPRAQRPSISRPSVRLRTDSVRPVQFYLHADDSIEAGHLVQWSGQPHMFLASGERTMAFDESRGHEHALTSVESLSNREQLAGIVLGTAADPQSTTYKHGGVHSNHPIRDHSFILRVLANGCALAWVLDTHENRLDGLYTMYRNGVETGQSVVRSLGPDHFTIEQVGNFSVDVDDRVTLLEEKFAELTG